MVKGSNPFGLANTKYEESVDNKRGVVYSIRIFGGGEMTSEFNVLEHEMVPEHHLLSDDQAKAVLKGYSIGKDQLPKIRKSDPCVKVLEEIEDEEIKEGRVIKVVRLNPVSGVSVAYRVVIRG